MDFTRNSIRDFVTVNEDSVTRLRQQVGEVFRIQFNFK